MHRVRLMHKARRLREIKERDIYVYNTDTHTRAIRSIIERLRRIHSRSRSDSHNTHTRYMYVYSVSLSDGKIPKSRYTRKIRRKLLAIYV